MRITQFFICLALFPVLSRAQSIDETPPPEMGQFKFLEGEWDCSLKFMQSDGSYAESKGRWSGGYTVGGHAFEDHWVSPGYRGTTWRTYEKASKRWANIFLKAGSPVSGEFTSNYFYGEFKDGEMHLKASDSDERGEYIDRIKFYDISENHFQWRQDRSYDGGKTWIDGITMIEASRIKAEGN